MRRVLLVMELILLLLPSGSRAFAQDVVTMQFKAIADAGPSFSEIDISASGNRVLYVKCNARHWWSFLPTGLRRFLTLVEGCKTRTLIVADADGKVIASMPYPDKRYWNPHLVGEDRITLGDYHDRRVRLMKISSGGQIEPIGSRVIQKGLSSSVLKVFGALFDGEPSVAFEQPPGRIALETLAGKDLHLLDDLHIEHANDVGLARNVIWFRVAIKKKVLDAYHGPAKIIARYPFPGRGETDVEEALGFAVFGPDSDAISAEILDFFREINPALPYVPSLGDLSYRIVDASPNGDILIVFNRSTFYLLEQRGNQILPVELQMPGGSFPGGVASDGRVIALKQMPNGHRLIEIGTPAY